MRVLVDTNVVLDFLQEREPFVEDAAKLFQLIDAGEIKGFIAATTITNIYYVVPTVGLAAAEDAITQILTDLQICKVDRAILEHAIAFKFRDFEDGVQYACAIAYGVDAIVTRDVSGFVASQIPVKSPGELILPSN